MSALTEYRVRWQREGRNASYRIYQAEAAARRKIDAILALEEVKGDTRHWEDMPDLVGAPELQVRDVGEWTNAQAQEVPSESALAGVTAWAGANDDLDAGIF